MFKSKLMMKSKAIIVGLGLLLGSAQMYAQYPQVKPEANAAYKEKTAEASKLEQAAWEKALVVVKEEAKHGRKPNQRMKLKMRL